MIKKAMAPMAILAICMSSCDVGTNNNSEQSNFNDVYNFIVDLRDQDAPAQVTQSNYSINENYLDGTVEISGSDIIISNQKYSFESDTLTLKPKTFGQNVSYKGFSKKGNISKGGATVTNFDGFMAAYYILDARYTSEILDPNYKFSYSISTPGYTSNVYFFPMLDYDLNDSYHVTTILQPSCYVGNSYVAGATETLSTKNTGYQVIIDFANKEAYVYVLGVELSSGTSDAPKVIMLEKVPVKMNHSDYTIMSDAPKTKIPGKTSEGKDDLVESSAYQVTDFKLVPTSSDFTEVSISYKVAGKTISFTGSSILKSAN